MFRRFRLGGFRAVGGGKGLKHDIIRLLLRLSRLSAFLLFGWAELLEFRRFLTDDHLKLPEPLAHLLPLFGLLYGPLLILEAGDFALGMAELPAGLIHLGVSGVVGRWVSGTALEK